MMDINTILSAMPYHIATVDVNDSRKELFYRPMLVSQSNIGHDLEKNAFAGVIDHISFHADGNYHLKYKAINRAKKHDRKLPLYDLEGRFPGKLIPDNPNKFKPLIIDSLYQKNGQWQLPIHRTALPHPILWDFSGIERFSIMVFLLHQQRDPLELFYSAGMEYLHFHRYYLQMQCFGVWKIVVIATWQTLPEIHAKDLPSFGLSSSNENFGRSLLVPNKLAFEYLSLGRSIIFSKPGVL